MADETAYDLDRAEEIVDRVVTTSRHRDHSVRYGLDVDDGLSVADIHENALQFYVELDLLQSMELGYPAVRTEGAALVPVSLSEITGDRGQPNPILGPLEFLRASRVSPIMREFIQNSLDRYMRRLGEGASFLLPAQADKTFRQGATRFLASRLAGNRELSDDARSRPPVRLSLAKWFGGPPTKVPGCLFSVHTQSPHLDAYWSGAYLIRSNYHAAPTTPAIGPLQAGTYVFGVSGGAYGSTVQWDINKVCTLPGTPNVHLPF